MKSPNVKINGWNEDVVPTIKIGNWDESVQNESFYKHNIVPTSKNYPSQMPLNNEMINSNGVRLYHVAFDGTLYGSKVADTRVWKSVDKGTTWTAIDAVTRPDNVVSKVHKFPSGEILAVTYEGKVFLSDENEDNFTLKYEFGTGMGDAFGMDVYEDMVFIAGYSGENYNKCWMSLDKGKTWKVILIHPDASISHFHDIRYDPYENIIWACSGDYYHKDNIFWSNDLGQTWETTYTGDKNVDIKSGVRATAIIPMPKCVLFVSDTSGEAFVWRYDRHPNGTQGNEVKPYKAWYYRRNVDTTTDFVGTIPAITYGANACAFFGWHCYRGSSNKIPAVIIGTTDGYTFVTIWAANELMQANNANYAEGGLMGVHSASDGTLYARYMRALESGVEENVVKVDFLGWG